MGSRRWGESVSRFRDIAQRTHHYPELIRKKEKRGNNSSEKENEENWIIFLRARFLIYELKEIG